MSKKTSIKNLLRLAAATGVCGTLIASSCSMEGMRAVSAGIDAAAGYLNEQQVEHDDISFGDWLLDELDDGH